VEWDEEGHFSVCGQMLDMSESESGTQTSRRITVAFTCTPIEMGGHHYGFCHWSTKDNGTKEYHLGIVDKLTKSAHFITISEKDPFEKLSKIYMEEIVRLHRVLASIVSDRDLRFTSKF
jgi:hypothetical protein